MMSQGGDHGRHLRHSSKTQTEAGHTQAEHQQQQQQQQDLPHTQVEQRRTAAAFQRPPPEIPSHHRNRNTMPRVSDRKTIGRRRTRQPKTRQR